MKLLKYDSFEVSERMPWKGYESTMVNRYDFFVLKSDHLKNLEE